MRRYQKSTALFTWLLGYEFPDTVMMVTKGRVVFITSMKKGAILDAISAKDGTVQVFKRDKNPRMGEAANKAAWNALFPSGSNGGVRLGILGRDKNEGTIIQEWLASCNGQYEGVDISPVIGELLAVKEETEQGMTKAAAAATLALMCKQLAKRVLTCVDEGKKIKHSALADEIELFIANNAGRLKDDLPTEMNVEYLDICYPPIIQSGGVYSLKPSAVSTNDNLATSGFILCSAGLRYRSYCANMARTFLIDGNEEQEGWISFAMQLQRFLAQQLRPQTLLSAVYAAGMEFVRKERPEMEKHLMGNFGFGIGLEFRAPEFVINAKCDRRVVDGMTFNLMVGLQDLQNGRGAVMIADTVLVTSTDSTGAVFLTKGLSDPKEISFTINASRGRRTQQQQSVSIKSRLRSQTTAAQSDNSADKRRREHQKELGKLRARSIGSLCHS